MMAQGRKIGRWRRRAGATGRLTRAAAAKRFGRPLAPVAISRVPVFAPTKHRPPERTWELVTPWGRVRVQGRLCQTHRQLLDAAVACHTASLDDPLGGKILTVDPYRLMRTMGTRSRNHVWIAELLDDLAQAKVEIRDTSGNLVVSSHIVQEFGRWDRRRIAVPAWQAPLLGREDRDLLYVALSGPWWALWGRQPAAHYAAHLPALGKLSGVGQAVARLCFTQPAGWQIREDKLLAAVGVTTGAGGVERKARATARAALRADAEGLEHMGITCQQGGLWRYRPVAGAVYVSPPPGQGPE